MERPTWPGTQGGRCQPTRKWVRRVSTSQKRSLCRRARDPEPEDPAGPGADCEPRKLEVTKAAAGGHWVWGYLLHSRGNSDGDVMSNVPQEARQGVAFVPASLQRRSSAPGGLLSGRPSSHSASLSRKPQDASKRSS